MRGLLLFLAGVLVGANIVYFVMRGQPEPVPATATNPATAAQPAAAKTAATPALPASPRPAKPAPAAAPALPATSPMPALLVPVAGMKPSQLQDTFNDARGEGARTHEALDIMAPRGTPVLAAVDGPVEKLFESVPGGLTIYQFDRDRTHAYYYAHLDRYAAGLAEGRQLQRGDVIGYVGSTGNASEDAPHLHFAIFVLGPEKRWWQGTAIDPYPLLKAAAAAP
jgi:murein DD-endopeptidase MepM/ murein hydrolase activator NlpD